MWSTGRSPWRTQTLRVALRGSHPRAQRCRLAMMKRLGIVAGLIVCAAMGVAQGHAHLQQASPAEGSHVHGASQLVLNFSEAARLAILTIERSGMHAESLVPPKDAHSTVTVALPKLAPGDYTVRWRVVGADGHVVPGQLHFSITQ
jgi:copper resistance protein C